MIRGLYIATSGLTSNERLQEMNANNIANANTVGYKSDDGVVRSFPEELQYRLDDPKGGVLANQKRIGSLGYGALLEEMAPRMVQGALKASDNPFARAIVDNPPPAGQPNRRSYFAVQAGGQTVYTRDGDFQVQTGTNYLVTSAGDPLLPIDATTGLPLDNLRIRPRQDGNFDFIDLATGQPYAAPQPPAPGPALTPQFGLVDILDSNDLIKSGDTYFTGGQADRSTGEMVAGQLEQSNVDLAAAMTSMMTVMRSYEANQRMVKTLDGTLEKAVSIGRLG